MNLIYIVKVSALTAVLWLIYKLLLRKDTFFNAKRFYFITGMFISFLLPLWRIKKVIPVDTTSLPIPINNLLTDKTVANNLQQGFDWNNLLYVLFAGTVVLLLKMLIDLTGIYRLIARGVKEQKNGFVLVKVDKVISPFSFGKYVVINPKQFTAEEQQMVIAHEQVHISQKHSIDVLLSSVFTALQWYNPFAWLWRNDLIENLEFIADNQVAKQVASVKSYQYLLLKTGVENPLPALVNSFYKPNLKNRIMMLQQQKSQSIKLLKFGILLPLIALFLYGFNTEKVYAQNKSKHYLIDKHTTAKQLKEIEKNINKEAEKFKVHFGNLMYIEDNLVNVDVSTHYFTTGKDTKLRIQNEKGILETTFYIKDGIFILSQKEEKTFSIYDEGVEVTTSDNNSKSFTTSSLQVKHYTKDGKEAKTKSNTGVIHYHEKDYFYTKSGNDYRFFDISGSETDPETSKVLLDELTSRQIFLIDSSVVDSKNPPLYILDGKIISKKAVEKLPADNILKITVLKGDAAKKKYGEKGKNGVVEITSKKKLNNPLHKTK